MTEFLNVDGGRIAYEVSGEGPLVVLAPGMGESRDAYRFVVPQLVSAGYRVAVTDLRGAGESDVTFTGFTRTDIAGDLVALIRHLGGPAVLVGHSISGGAVTIAAATAPELVSAIVELAPFTRAQAFSVAALRVKRVRQGSVHLAGAMFGSVKQWLAYLEVSYPGQRPADWTGQLARIEANLREPGRMKTLQKMTQSTPADAGAQLGSVRCPALIIEGTLDPDWADPKAEGEAIVAAMPAGVATLALVEGAGHYPHTQFPDQVVTHMLPFLAAAVRA
ncbi:alpha/beta fold hydrolase [Winogradskya humida]|uniref:Hydrolase n=1 Tax=Winogradskya humida TaxID=113566 RepID=A0ABQ4A2J4_9ACTN|nr:alpha/beta hydrolase [Actinoplanes humidus]GIE25053.1 hydrolase [Actinoplanes humidus]